MTKPADVTRNINLHVGALAPTLAEQLLLTAIPEEPLTHLQADLNAAARLSIRGYMNAGALKKTREKVLRKVQELFKQYGWKTAEEMEKVRQELELKREFLEKARQEVSGE